MSSKHIAACVTVAVALLALVGCGRSAETSGLNLPEYTAGTSAPALDPVRELLAASRKAFAAAGSVTVEGVKGDDLVVDLAFRGEDGSGTVTLGPQEFRVIMVGGTAWYRGDVPFYEAIGLVPKEVADATDARWIQSGSPAIAAIDRFSTRSAFAAEFLDVGDVVTLTPETTIDGVAAVGLTSGAGTLFVDPDTALPIRLTASPHDTAGGIALSYDEVTPPAAPSAGEILDPAAFS